MRVRVNRDQYQYPTSRRVIIQVNELGSGAVPLCGEASPDGDGPDMTWITFIFDGP